MHEEKQYSKKAQRVETIDVVVAGQMVREHEENCNTPKKIKIRQVVSCGGARHIEYTRQRAVTLCPGYITIVLKG
jgi:hypothetical protein